MKKIEYFLNAMCYRMWVFIMNSIIAFQIRLYKFYPKCIRKRWNRNIRQCQRIDNGYFTIRAESHIVELGSVHGACITALTLPWLMEYFDRLYIKALIVLPIAIGCIVYGNFTRDSVRIPYYKKFMKKSVQWHKKWARITMAVYVISYLVLILLLYLASCIFEARKEKHNLASSHVELCQPVYCNM